MRQFDPDTVVTFGADGGYGHPDHVAVSEVTTATVRELVRHHNRGQRLYHSVFPPRRTSMAEELAHWITNSGQRATDRAALQAIRLFVGESATLRLARDDVRVEWFPPGIAVIEQGERADALYLILSGTADALLAQPDGQVTWLRRMEAGEFFGELGLVEGKRTAHVVAGESLTCLVLSRTPVRPYAGRGARATIAPEGPATKLPLATCAVDVTSCLHRKLGALARHRTQYPIIPSMLPPCLLRKMLGTEFFCRARQRPQRQCDQPLGEGAFTRSPTGALRRGGPRHRRLPTQEAIQSMNDAKHSEIRSSGPFGAGSRVGRLSRRALDALARNWHDTVYLHQRLMAAQRPWEQQAPLRWRHQLGGGWRIVGSYLPEEDGTSSPTA